MAFTPSLAAAALYGGLNAFLVMTLAAMTIRRRVRAGVPLGDGGDAMLLRAIRAHGNAAETVPLALVLLTLAALAGAPPAAIHFLGLSLTLGRVLHAVSLHRPDCPMIVRVAGMALTMLCLGVTAAGLVAHGVGAL